jgi:hypothetical protein
VIVEAGGPEPWADQDLRAIGDRLAAVGGVLAVSPDAGRGVSLSGTIPLA